jgi:HlyD family secretion protein
MAQQATERNRGWVWAVVAVAACFALILLLRLRHTEVPVRADRVERRDIVSTVSTNGKVEPTQDFQAHAPVPGVVQGLYVDLGQTVHAGQELLRMDDSEARKNLATAQANLDSSLATLNAMEHGGTQDELLTSKTELAQAQTQQQLDIASLASLQKLQAQGAASPNEVAAAQQRLAATKAHLAQLQARRTGRYATDDLAAQRAQVTQARAALDAAQKDYANVDVHAPFAGTVYALPVAQYDYVQSGEALVDVADLNKLQIFAYFDEPEIGKLAAGQSVKIEWPAKPNQIWHGHILEAPTTIITYGTRNVGECLIAVDDAHGDLLPNTNVTVTVTTQSRTNALSLPREALRTEGASNFVYRIVNGQLVKTPVQVGGVVNLTRFEVAGGLNEGDRVALNATTETDLSDGLHVRIVP